MRGTEYKWVGTHPQEITGGRVLEPGERVTLDDEAVDDQHNQALIATGNLVSIEEQKEPEATPAAIELAEQRGVVLTAVSGSGTDGRITKEDVERHLEAEEGRT